MALCVAMMQYILLLISMLSPTQSVCLQHVSPEVSKHTFVPNRSSVARAISKGNRAARGLGCYNLATQLVPGDLGCWALIDLPRCLRHRTLIDSPRTLWHHALMDLPRGLRLRRPH